MDDCRNCLYVGEKLKEGMSGALQGIQLFCIITRNECHEYVKCHDYKRRVLERPHARMFTEGAELSYDHFFSEMFKGKKDV